MPKDYFSVSYADRSETDLSQGQHLQSVKDLKASRLCGYLIALAAVQRGLDVVFYGSTKAAGRKIRGTHRSAELPRFVMLSDGEKNFFFDYTAGDLTTRNAASLADAKMRSKVALANGGVPVPGGTIFSSKNRAPGLKFIESSSAKVFLGKPAAGSHSLNIFRNLDRATAIRFVKTVRVDKGAILEEQINGTEYRVYVVGDRIAGAWKRSGATVIGDGQRNFAQLIAERNARRSKNPQMKGQIISTPEAAAFLAKTGKSLQMVPVFGQKALIAEGVNSRAGGIDVDVFGELPISVAESAIAACQALGLPNGGCDIIERNGLGYVLEVNPRAAIGKHSFPEFGTGPGNTVAEAIVDHYFPSIAGIERDAGIALNVDALNSAFAQNGVDAVHAAQIIRG